MTEEEKPGPERPAMGRPRAEDRTPAILDAANELLEQVGYDRVRIQDVADRAGAGLATLYRRWPTKQALVADAIRHHADALLPPVNDDPMEDLLALYRTMTEKVCAKDQALLPGMIAALRSEAELAEAVREVMVDPMLERARVDIARIVGADNPSVDLLAELVPALLMFRTVIRGEDVVPDDFLKSVLDVISAMAEASTAQGSIGSPAWSAGADTD